ncbi:hypothetical protein JTE90_014256 [Oedothorax gibbosus]|uniref:Uncharacterized protein n=1 Tax=Oedothorax gibbosus TaxID=931172 RepID=A0AAV6UCS6_9ARAC|nr:hypothetical protein JTE90_014256 [Oedothorax gibbosus]
MQSRLKSQRWMSPHIRERTMQNNTGLPQNSSPISTQIYPPEILRGTEQLLQSVRKGMGNYRARKTINRSEKKRNY